MAIDMISCKQASYLASKQLDGKLSWTERIALTLHIAMCSLCRRYVKDTRQLQKLLRKTANSGQALVSGSVKLSDQSRKRIQQVINKALQQMK